MSKAVDTKKKEEVVVATPAPAVKEVVAKPAAKVTKIDSAFPEKAPFGKTMEEHVKEIELQKANVELIDKIERDALLKVTLQSYYKHFGSVNDDSEAKSSLIINGEKVEPALKGLTKNFEEMTSSFGRSFSHFDSFALRRGNRRGAYSKRLVESVEESFDVYIYKIKRPTGNSYQRHSVELDKLVTHLTDEWFYQILVLGENATVTLTPEFKEPSPWAEEMKVWTKAFGLATIRNSAVIDTLFSGVNMLDNCEANNCTFVDSAVSNNSDWRSVLKSVDLNRSQADATRISISSEMHWARARVIGTYLIEYSFTGRSLNIDKSSLTNVSTNAAGSTRIKNSRLTNINLNAKESILVNNTALHHEEQQYYNTGDDINIRSIFDLTVVRYSNVASISLVRGQNSFWVGGTNDEEGLKVVELKSNDESDDCRRGYGYPPRFGCSESIESQIRNHISPFVHRDIGKSELTGNIINNIVRTIVDRINIADTIATVGKIKIGNNNGVW